jgi:hypothetical protein
MNEVPAPAPAGTANATLGEIRARVCLTLAVLAFGGLAVRVGQTASWDLRNYHLYNAWAWIEGRHALDIAPAQLQSFFNPLLHALLFAGTQWLHPVAFEFVLGCVQGLNAVLLYVIARRLLPDKLQQDGPWFALATAVVGATGATQLGELGGTAGDNLVSLAVLGGVAVALPGADGRIPASRWVLAGVVMGAGLGLKLAFAPLVLGLGIAALVVAPGGLRRWQIALAFGAAGALGFALTAGFWMTSLWREYGNPVYPLFAAWFDGDMAPPFDTRDLRFLPPDALSAAFYPVAWTGDWRLVSEVRFRDLRMPLLFLAALLLPWWRARPAGDPNENGPVVGWLWLAIALGYVGWLALFGYYRYLAPWEMLAPLALCVLLVRALPGFARVRAVAAVLLFVMFAGTNAPEWGVARRYGSEFLDVALPDSPAAGGALVLIAGDAPMAYLALGFPRDARFVRVQANFHGGDLPPFGMDRRVADAIDAFDGPLLALYTASDAPPLPTAWSRFGVRVMDRCGEVRSNLMRGHEPPVILCEVARVRPARQALATVFEAFRR